MNRFLRRPTRVLPLLVLLLAACEGGTEPKQPDALYEIVSLEPLRAGSVSQIGPVLGINEVGQVAGSTPGTDGEHAAVWSDGVVTDLGIVGSAMDINDDGVVVGSYAPPSDPGFPSRAAFVWRDGVVTTLAQGGGLSPSAFAAAVNESGAVAGAELGCAGGCVGSAFVARGGQIEELGTHGAPASAARGLNNEGIVVGSLHFSRGANQRAFTWRNGEFTFLKPEMVFSRANAINDEGEVAGVTSAFGSHHAVLWRGGEAIDIGTLPGLDVGEALSINNRDQVVGISYGSAASARAFLWQDSRMLDLNDLVPTNDWVLERATDINDRGQIVVIGRNQQTGETGALLLNPVR